MPIATNEKKRQRQDDEEEEGRKRKGIKYKEADLKVIVGAVDDEVDDDDSLDSNSGKDTDESKQQNVFWYIAEVLASQSNYVDTLLSNPLSAAIKIQTQQQASNNPIESPPPSDGGTKKRSSKKQKITTTNVLLSTSSSDHIEISFPDLTPSQWQRMMEFLNNPLASRAMSIQDAMEVCILYDKYEFTTGIELCDGVLSSHIYKTVKPPYNSTWSTRLSDIEELDTWVDIVVLSYEKNLYRTNMAGMYWLEKVLGNSLFSSFETRVIFSVSHIRKLVPAIDHFIKSEHTEEQRNFGQVTSALLNNTIASKLLLTDENYDINDYDEAYKVGENIDVLNPLFPQLFVAHLRLIAAQRCTADIVNEIELVYNGEGIYHDENDLYRNMAGTYNYLCEGRFIQELGDVSHYLMMRDNVGDWIIQNRTDDTDTCTKLFVCKGSRCKLLPPPTGWMIAGTNNKLTYLTFSYYHNGEYGRKKIEVDKDKHE